MASIEQKRETALFRAAELGKTELVRKLISIPGVEVNFQNLEGKSPLYIACERGHLAVVSVLLSARRIDVNRRANDQSGPLHVACRSGRKNLVAELLKMVGIQIGIKDKDGRKPEECIPVTADSHKIIELFHQKRSESRSNGEVAQSEGLKVITKLPSNSVSATSSRTATISSTPSDSKKLVAVDSLSPPPSSLKVKKYDVFLSHAWGIGGQIHGFAKDIAVRLRQKGYDVFLDEFDLGGNMLRGLGDAIAESRLFACFLTREYCSKVEAGDRWPEINYCSLEFEWAVSHLRSKRMILLTFEESMNIHENWGTRIQFNFPSQRHLDMTSWAQSSKARKICFGRFAQEIDTILRTDLVESV